LELRGKKELEEWEERGRWIPWSSQRMTDVGPEDGGAGLPIPMIPIVPSSFVLRIAY